MSERATVAFELSCFQPGDEEPLWTVDVRHVAGGKSEREVAIHALRQTFRSLLQSAKD